MSLVAHGAASAGGEEETVFRLSGSGVLAWKASRAGTSLRSARPCLHLWCVSGELCR